MRRRALGICILALLGLGCGGVAATAAQAKKTNLWLSHSGIRATPGEPASVVAYIEECTLEQRLALTSNGKPADQFAVGATNPSPCPPPNKLAGSFTKITASPGRSAGTFTLTLQDKIHVQVEPWCTYQLAPKISGGAQTVSAFSTSVPATLDKAASFGSCPATHEVFMSVFVSSEEGALYEREEPATEA